MFEYAIEILNKLEENGFKSYIVGGYPRDLILNRKSLDVDICTNARPKDLKEIFKNDMLPKVDYGSVTILYHNVKFEITTFRKDLKYDKHRLPIKIKYVNNLKADLKRRDFTINTICIDKNQNIIDLLNGRKEIKEKIIKTVGNPKYKLKEDSLRILRAIRFATILDFELDYKLKKYIKKYSYLLKELSYYRKREELEKIFESSNIKKGLKLIKELELDNYLELSNLDNLKITSSTIGIWAQLNVENIYNFNSNEIKIIKQINELLTKDVKDNYNLYKYGINISSIVAEIQGIDVNLIKNKYNKLPIKSEKEINITPLEICEILNKKPDAFLKEVYKDLEMNILNNKLENNLESLKKYVNFHKKNGR